MCGLLVGTTLSFADKAKDEATSTTAGEFAFPSATEAESRSGTESTHASATMDDPVPATADASASAAGRMGKTVFLGVSILGKQDRAARRMTKLHQEYAEEGWTVVNVAPYTENGDLEGFFITYIK